MYFDDFQSPIKLVPGRILTSSFRRSVVDDEKNAYTRNQLAATSGSWSKWTLKMAIMAGRYIALAASPKFFFEIFFWPFFLGFGAAIAAAIAR